MSGHIRRRGDKTWELKFDLGTDALTGKRHTRYHSFKGTKREAEIELTRLKASSDEGEYIDASKETLSQFLGRWEAWVSTQVSAKTLERYKELATHHVRPHLGAVRLQRLKAIHFAELYSKLLKEGRKIIVTEKSGTGEPLKVEKLIGLSPRTVGHVHRLLHSVMGRAVKWSIIGSNPVAAAEPPRVERTEIDILAPDQVKTLLRALRGDALYPIAVIGLATGMRRGEIVALRWGDIDLDRGKVRAQRSLEQTNTGLQFKAPKTKAGRREISIPPSIITELRAHWKKQGETRLAIGLGRAGVDDLAFPRPDGEPWPPDSLTSEWARAVRILKLPSVTLHGLRHTHASQLIAAGLEIVTVSRRLGHSNPSVTLNVYAHLFGNTDETAAGVIEIAFASVLAD